MDHEDVSLLKKVTLLTRRYRTKSAWQHSTTQDTVPKSDPEYFICLLECFSSSVGSSSFLLQRLAFDYCGHHRLTVLNTTESELHIQHIRFWRHSLHVYRAVKLNYWNVWFHTNKASEQICSWASGTSLLSSDRWQLSPIPVCMMQRDACTFVGCGYLIGFTLSWQILVTSYDSENCCFELTKPSALCWFNKCEPCFIQSHDHTKG